MKGIARIKAVGCRRDEVFGDFGFNATTTNDVKKRHYPDVIGFQVRCDQDGIIIYPPNKIMVT